MEHRASLEDALKSRKQITDDFFGQVQVDTDYSSAQKKKYLIYTKMYNDEKIADREAALKRKRKALRNEFFVNLEDYTLEIKKNLCSTNYIVRSFYEFPQKSLKREIYTRRKNSKTAKFTMEEMTHLFYNTVLAGKKLQENGKTHGDISPFSIFHNNEGKFKLAPCPIESVSSLKVQQEKSMKGQPLYLSPQMLFAVKKRKPKAQCDQHKSDMFSLGLVLLEAGLLKPIGNIYSGSTINETALKQHISEFEAIYCDNPLLFSSLQRMLELNEEDRADFIGLNTVIPPYKEVCEYFYNLQHGIIDPDAEDEFDEGFHDPGAYNPNFPPQDGGIGYSQQYDEYGNPIANQADEYNQMMDQNHFPQQQDNVVQGAPMGRQQNQNFNNQGYEGGYQNPNQNGYQDQNDNYGNQGYQQQGQGGYQQQGQPQQQGQQQPEYGYNQNQNQNQNHDYNQNQNQDYNQNQGYNNQQEQANDPYGQAEENEYYDNQPQPQANQPTPEGPYGGYNQPLQQQQPQQQQPPQQQQQPQQQYGGYNPPQQQPEPQGQYGGYQPQAQPPVQHQPPQQAQPQNTAPTYGYNPPQSTPQSITSSLKESDPYGQTNEEIENRYKQKASHQPVTIHKKQAYEGNTSYTTGASTTVPSNTYSNYNPSSTYSGNTSFTPAPTSATKYGYNLSNNTPAYGQQPPSGAFVKQASPPVTTQQPSNMQDGAIVVRNGKQYRQTKKTVEEVVNGQVVKKTTLYLTPV